ncbi:MAG: Rab family GTPase [Promethearchaeota archaeon]
MEDILFKLCIFGDGGVGKTTLINKYLTGLFKDSKVTIGVDFKIKRLNMYEMKIALQIWDFAGEDRFRFLLPSYIKGASGGIFMYDITRHSSLDNLNEWLAVLKKGLSNTEERIPILLVGGKKDLNDYKSIESEYAYELVKSYNLSGYIECSSKTGENVEKVFQYITYLMLENSENLKSNLTNQSLVENQNIYVQ